MFCKLWNSSYMYSILKISTKHPPPPNYHWADFSATWQQQSNLPDNTVDNERFISGQFITGQESDHLRLLQRLPFRALHQPANQGCSLFLVD